MRSRFAAVSATVAGVVPAIAITGRAISQNIRGGSRVRFGRLTGALVVADIAVSVAAVGMAFAVSGHATDLQAADRATGIPASEYLAVEFRLPDDARESATATDVADQMRCARNSRRPSASSSLRSSAEPGVRRVAVGDVLPRMEHRSEPYELDGVERAPDAPLRWTRLARVDVDFLDALGTPILSAVAISCGPMRKEGARVAIVNTAFVERALEGRDPIGRRVRFPTLSDTGNAAWYEIVGVVGPLGVNVVNADRGEAVYLPAAPGTINPMQLGVHATVPPASLTARVRELAMAVDPDLVMGRSVGAQRRAAGRLVSRDGARRRARRAGRRAHRAGHLRPVRDALALRIGAHARDRHPCGAWRVASCAACTILKRSLVQIGLGAAIGLPIAARFVFELTGTPDGGGSVVTSVAMRLVSRRASWRSWDRFLSRAHPADPRDRGERGDARGRVGRIRHLRCRPRTVCVYRCPLSVRARSHCVFSCRASTQ